MDYSGKIIRKTPVTPSQTSASGVWSLDEALQAQRTNTWPIANVPDPISRSLRFRRSASAFLSRTPSVTGNRKTWTWSGWVKRGQLGINATLFSGGIGNGDSYTNINFNTSDQMYILDGVPGSNPYLATSSMVFRDPSAWYHIVVQVDTTQATTANRVRAYVNGNQITLNATANYSQNADTSMNNSSFPNFVGSTVTDPAFRVPFDGYMAEVNFIDGQALTPSSFGGTNPVTGVWEPRPYTGTYGTNGFLLTFSDITSTTTLGNDTSGNGNNFATNNISLTAGSTYDSMLDVPTQWIGYNTGDVASVTRGNYAVMNPLINAFSGSTFTFSNANLTTLVSVQTAYPQPAVSTMPLLSNGKTYCEITLSAQGRANTWKVGITKDPRNSGSTSFGGTSGDYSWEVNGNISPTNPVIMNNNSSLGLYGTAITTNDVVMLAYDGATGKLWLGRNGTWFSSGDPAAGTNAGLSGLTGDFYVGVSTGGTTNDTNTYQVNFGQRPFAYTPPAGFLALCTTNLPNPTILQGDDYFNAVLWAGNSSTQNITGVGFQPDLVWIKSRTSTSWNAVLDSVRGATGSVLFTNSTVSDTTYTEAFSSFNADGFTLTGSPSSGGSTNVTGNNYVGWNWKANGTGITNTAGSITSTVSANTTSGFSIVTYTGNGSSGTVGHGLGVAPRMVIVKNRSTTADWPVYFSGVTSATEIMRLNSTTAKLTGRSEWNSTLPTSTVFSVGNDSAVNTNGNNYVAYCFAQVAGFSAFGSYTGNGSADGPFVYLGFRPRYIMIKRTDSANWWLIWDSARNTFNANPQNYLQAESANSENNNGASPFIPLDALSNGFKIRDAGPGVVNASGGTFIFAAFAENPFKNALAR